MERDNNFLSSNHRNQCKSFSKSFFAGKFLLRFFIYFAIAPFWNCLFEAIGFNDIANLHNYIGFLFLAFVLVDCFVKFGFFFNSKLAVGQITIVLLFFVSAAIYSYDLDNIFYQLYYFAIPFFVMHIVLQITNYSDFVEGISANSFIVRIILTLAYIYTFMRIRYSTTAEAMIMSYPFLPIALIGFASSTNKVINMISSIISCISLLVFGNRAMIVCIVAFFFFFVLINLLKAKNGLLVFTSIVVVSLIVFYIVKNNSDNVINYLYIIKNQINLFGARTEIIDQIISLIDGFDNSIWHGRDILAASSYNAINDNPLGYGVGGSRYAMLTYYGAYIYPHNIVLEFIIDFGVLLGPILLIIFFAYLLMAIFSSKEKKFLYFIAILISCGVIKLFMSDSYLSTFSFWIVIAFFPAFMNSKYKYTSKTRSRLYEGANCRF